MLLADEFFERLWPVAAGNYLVLGRFQFVVGSYVESHCDGFDMTSDEETPHLDGKENTLKRRRMRDPPHKERTTYGC